MAIKESCESGLFFDNVEVVRVDLAGCWQQLHRQVQSPIP